MSTRHFELTKTRPILPIPEICRTTGWSLPAARSTLNLLVDLQIAREITGKYHNRLFVCAGDLAILNQATEAL